MHLRKQIIPGLLLFAYLVIASQTLGNNPSTPMTPTSTDPRKFHLQLSNEYDILQRSAYPGLRQNTTVFELDYGLLKDVEIGVDGPLIAISNSHVTTPQTRLVSAIWTCTSNITFSKSERVRVLPALAATLTSNCRLAIRANSSAQDSRTIF